MRKIRASVLRKVEESRLTNKELTVFLHICQYQTDAGTVSGIYYKDICNALKISNQSFYSSLYRLRDCGLINLWKADKIDWDIQIIGNDCTDIESVKKEGYLSVADGLFASEKFRKLKARDTAELAKQYRQDIAEMQKAGVLPEDIFGYLIGKARDGLAGKLNPKYIHKVLRNEIANFQRAKKMAVASGTQAFQNFTGRTNNNYMEKVLAQWSMM